MTGSKVYRLAVAVRFQGRGRVQQRHGVAVRRARIGTTYNGEPQFTEAWEHKALCGARVVPAPRWGEHTAADATCPKCRAELRKLGEIK